MKDLKKKFHEDFLDPTTRETDILMIITRLKNYKDFIH
jgi:hypothetical protein